MEAENPYTIPVAELADPAQVRERLYKSVAVGLATFLGSPLAGAYILTRNLKALGRSGEAGGVWAIAVALLAVTMICAFLLPEEVPALPFTIVQILVMGWLSNSRTATDLAQHLEQDGAFHSNWRAAGIGLLFALALVAVMLPVVFLLA